MYLSQSLFLLLTLLPWGLNWCWDQPTAFRVEFLGEESLITQEKQGMLVLSAERDKSWMWQVWEVTAMPWARNSLTVLRRSTAGYGGHREKENKLQTHDGSTDLRAYSQVWWPDYPKILQDGWREPTVALWPPQVCWGTPMPTFTHTYR